MVGYGVGVRFWVLGAVTGLAGVGSVFWGAGGGVGIC